MDNGKKWKKKKRRTQGIGKEDILVLLFCLVCFPYFLSNFSARKQLPWDSVKPDTGGVTIPVSYALGVKNVPIEEYLVGMLAACCPKDAEPEMLKAQAVILRSRVAVYCASHKEMTEMSEPYWDISDCRREWGEEWESVLEVFSQAVQDTKDFVLTRKGSIVSPPFFFLSNGNTRGGSEYKKWGKEYEYLKSVSCEKDVLSPAYENQKEYTQTEWEDSLKKTFSITGLPDKIVLLRDAKGYVDKVRLGDLEIEGEAFRRIFHIPSSDFTLETVDGKLLISTKGKGHGFGFCQNTANELAKQGQTFEEILTYFFEDLQLERKKISETSFE